jgi:16S rRNA (cytosine1402-N4)-methyltransferase
LTDVLKPGGRAVIITFHSLEDRIVKTFFKNGTFEEKTENPFENTKQITPFKLINKKALTASKQETKMNTRARSAKLRVAEKI